MKTRLDMVGVSVGNHRRIRARLARKDMAGAATLLEAHWQRGMQAVLDAIPAAT